MFAIGDPQWPGLSKLTEECGEVLQVIGKIMATHGEVAHWDGSNLRQRLLEELGDLAGAFEFVTSFLSSSDRLDVRHRARTKYALFQRWHLAQGGSPPLKRRRFRDGGKPGADRQSGPRATQKGAATPGKERPHKALSLARRQRRRAAVQPGERARAARPPSCLSGG